MNMKIKLNDNFGRIKESYLFSDIAKKVSAYQKENPDKEIIRLGIGDVTLPLTSCVTSAMRKAVVEQSVKGSFRGYAPEYGYDFIRQAGCRLLCPQGSDAFGGRCFMSEMEPRAISAISPIFSEIMKYCSQSRFILFMWTASYVREEGLPLLTLRRRTAFFPSPGGQYSLCDLSLFTE